jgi:diacylglycerol kinase (ATP)
MTRIALLVNPESGSGEAEQVAGTLRSHGAEVHEHPLAQAASLAGADRVVAASGDGALGVAAEAAARLGVPLGVVPAGTANDVARALDQPDDVRSAARLAATGERTRAVDLARMGRRPFLNAASIGLSPVAARAAHGLKRPLGAIAYLVGGMRAGFTAQPVRCEVACDGTAVFAGAVWQATIASTGAFGGGAEVGADPGDGRLDGIAIEARSRARLAIHAAGLRRGSIKRQRGVRSWQGRVIDVTVPSGTAFNVDGELVRSGPVRFRVEPRAVRVVVG